MLDMRHGKCALCGGEEIIEAPARDSYGDAAQFFELMSVAVEPEGVLRAQRRIAPIMMYVCRGCGFLQCFATDPKTIPVDEEHGTRRVERYDEGITVDGDEEIDEGADDDELAEDADESDEPNEDD